MLLNSLINEIKIGFFAKKKQDNYTSFSNNNKNCSSNICNIKTDSIGNNKDINTKYQTVSNLRKYISSINNINSNTNSFDIDRNKYKNNNYITSNKELENINLNNNITFEDTNRNENSPLNYNYSSNINSNNNNNNSNNTKRHENSHTYNTEKLNAFYNRKNKILNNSINSSNPYSIKTTAICSPVNENN